MSRVIVKNLPKKVTGKRVHKVFSSKGEITDLQLKYTKDGVFRQFAIIGFKTVEQAEATKEYFNESFFDASKIQVEICSDFGDPSKPKSWSKYSKDSSSYKKKEESKDEGNPENITKERKKSEVKHKSKYQEMLDEVENDEGFNEFLELHKKGPNKPVWSNDVKEVAPDDDSSESSRDSDEDITEEPETEKKEEKLVSSEKTCTNEFDNEFTVKLKGLPYKCKKKNIKEFFRPLKIVSLRLPPKIKGIAYVKLESEKAMNKALNKHRSYLSGHKINVMKYTKIKEDEPNDEMPNKYADKLKDLDEGIAESGRIFVRNLSYTVTEEDLENLFKSYGTLTEVNLPIDSFTKKIKGFAFITFMFPENAVKAFSELDKTSFQGRLLHLLPSKPKIVQEEKPSNISSYKQKREARLKEICGSSESWNTLFLGVNALADVVADKYNTTKAELLDSKTKKESIAVRMALGETQIVEETRQFLIEQGVELDSFTPSAGEHSKTVILVKNLPAKTKAKEIREVFEKFGSIIRVVLPPSGIAAIVEFESPSEAKNAFNKLSYSRFRYVPLYLEWAPVNVFRSPPILPNNTGNTTEEKDVQSPVVKNDDGDDTQPVNSTLFVKNLNFTTTEEVLRKHFQKAGKIHQVTIATKKDADNPGSLLSMGFGFITYKQKESAQNALKTLQHSVLDGREIELKFSNRATQSVVARKESPNGKQNGSKILIRNIPFEATVKEVEELFRVFGELKYVRLPKKMTGTGSHRGFGFVDFVTKNDAKRAFNALCHSTHLYGRRLVLEWANSNDADVSTLRRKTADNFYKAPSKKQKTSIEL